MCLSRDGCLGFIAGCWVITQPLAWLLPANANCLLRPGTGSSAASEGSAYTGRFWLRILGASSGRSLQTEGLESRAVPCESPNEMLPTWPGSWDDHPEVSSKGQFDEGTGVRSDCTFVTCFLVSMLNLLVWTHTHSSKFLASSARPLRTIRIAYSAAQLEVRLCQRGMRPAASNRPCCLRGRDRRFRSSRPAEGNNRSSLSALVARSLHCASPPFSFTQSLVNAKHPLRPQAACPQSA